MPECVYKVNTPYKHDKRNPIFCICWNTSSESTDLWHLPNVSSAFILNFLSKSVINVLSQPPSEFTEAMLDSVSSRSSQLHEFTVQIEEAVHDLISILLGHTKSPPHSPHPSLSAGSRRHSGKQTMNLTPRTEASSGDTSDDMMIGDILCKFINNYNKVL